jgi:CheY-like chemotaxis protein
LEEIGSAKGMADVDAARTFWLMEVQNYELNLMRTNKNPQLATRTHELRTPLNAIIGFTGTLLMRLPGPLNEDQEKQLRIIQESARQLLSTINGMADTGGTAVDAARTACMDQGARQSVRSGGEESGREEAHGVAARARVLVIEDDEASRKLVVCLLKAVGFEVLVAEDGERGLAMARANLPDLILCDVDLPGMDGFQIAAALKRDAALRGIPVIAVSAFALAGEQDKTLSARFDHWIAKPIDPWTFVTQLKPFFAR